MTENKTKISEFKVLVELKNGSRNLLKKMLSIMRELDNYGIKSDIIDEVNYCTQADKIKILEFLQNYILETIKDSQCIIKEIDTFSNVLQTDGEEGIDNKVKTFPFLATVWFGDVYDKEGFEALDLLLSSVNDSIKMANDDQLINLAKNHFIGI